MANLIWRLKKGVKVSTQKLFFGYTDSDLWNLDVHLAKVILPRIKAFRNMEQMGHPVDLTEEEWYNILDKMIYSFQTIKDEDHIFAEQEADPSRIQQGLNLFAYYFQDLWD